MSEFGHRGGGKGGGRGRGPTGPSDYDPPVYLPPARPIFLKPASNSPPASQSKRYPEANDIPYAHRYEPGYTDYHGLRPGPLHDKSNYDEGKALPGDGFTAGKYNETTLKEDTLLHRTGAAGREAGEWFTKEPPTLGRTGKIHRAAKDGGTTPSEMHYTWSFPKGTKVYNGPGPDGHAMYHVQKPWEIDGAQVVSRTPLGGARVQAKRNDAPARGRAAIPQSGGTALPGEVRSKMEGQLGADLSGVTVHTGAESAQAAEQLGARAFTDGTRVHFAPGEFAPGTKEGDRLIGHELAHVVQGQRSGIARKADEQHQGDAPDQAEGAQHEVSQPGDPAEKEADAAGDKIADNLHGKNEGDAAEAAGDHADSAEHLHGDASAQTGDGHRDSDGGAGGGRKIAAARPPIEAKAAAVGRKIFRASRPGDPRANRPAPMAGKGPPPPAPDRPKSPEETAAEQWCDTHIPLLSAFNAEVAWDFTALNQFEAGLKRYIYSPALAQNAKVQAAQKLLKEKKAALEATCVADMARVSAQLDKLDEHNPASYEQAQNIEAATARWSQQFGTPEAGIRGHDAFRMTRLRGEALLARILKNRDAALQKTLGEIAGIKTDEAEAGAHLSKSYDAAQAWLNPKLPDPNGLMARLRNAYFDKKMAVLEAQEAKQKKQKEEQEKQQAQASGQGGQGAAAGPAGAGGAADKHGGAAHGPAPAKHEAGAAAKPEPKEEKPPVPPAQEHAQAPSEKKAGADAKPPDTHAAASSASTHAPDQAPARAPDQQPAHAAHAAVGEKKPESNAPQLDGSEGAAFHKLTENKLTYASETYDQMKQAVLQAIAEQKRKDPELGALLESIPLEQIMAIRGYTTQDYKAINSSLRGYVPRDEQGKDTRELKDPKLRVEPAELLQQLKPYINLATVGLSKLPRHHGTVYRSTHIKPGTDRFKQNTTPGTVVKDAAFTSTSADHNIKMRSDDNFKFVIDHKNGRRVDFLSQFENEKEVLFAPGTSFQVTSVEKELDGDTMRYIVALKEVG